MEPIFRPVPSHPGYSATSDGRIWSHKTQKFLKPKVNRDGYLVVCGRLLHHLVLDAFHGSRPPGSIGLHNDDNRLNNSPDNLRWGTKLENWADHKRNNPNYRKGSLNKTSKLTEAQAQQLKRMRSIGWSVQDLAARFHLNPSTVKDICSGKLWAYLNH